MLTLLPHRVLEPAVDQTAVDAPFQQRDTPPTYRTRATTRALRTTASVLIVLLAGLLAGCGTSVRVNGVEVDKQVGFLTVIEQKWRGDAAGGGDPHASQAEDTHCWLARDPDSGAVQSSAYCGPIRHLSGATPDGVFDEMTFRPEFVGDRQVQVKPETVDLAKAGVPAPAGLELYNPQAGEPDDAEGLPAPEAPRADSGIVTTTDDNLIQNATTPADSNLIAPNLQVTITKTGTVSRVSGGEDDPVPYYQPAEGEEFLAFTVHRHTVDQFDQDYVSSESDLSPTYTVTSLVTNMSLTDWFTSDSDDATVVMSVPTGQDAQLVVGVAGVDQTLSVRTGQRTSTTAAAYYLPQTTIAVQKQYSDTVDQGDFHLTHGVTFTDATISPYDPSAGWAPAGQMYLTLACEHAQVTQSGDESYAYSDPSFDSTTSVTATGTAKETVQLITRYPSNPESQLTALTFLLPADTQGVNITYAPKGTFAADSNIYDTSNIHPSRGTFTFATVKLDISFR